MFPELETKLQPEHHLSSITGGGYFTECAIGLSAVGGELRRDTDSAELGVVEGIERLPAEFKTALLAAQEELLKEREIMVVESWISKLCVVAIVAEIPATAGAFEYPSVEPAINSSLVSRQNGSASLYDTRSTDLAAPRKVEIVVRREGDVTDLASGKRRHTLEFPAIEDLLRHAVPVEQIAGFRQVDRITENRCMMLDKSITAVRELGGQLLVYSGVGGTVQFTYIITGRTTGISVRSGERNTLEEPSIG